MADRHSILVVDDEVEVVNSLKGLLRLDYIVTGASSAAEAMEILARQPIHIVMTDQRMPEMTGAELLRSIHQQYPDIIRLLFTGYADVKAVIDAVNKGHVYRYINKPWNPEELLAIVRDAGNLYDLVIERKQLIEQLQQKNAELKQASELKSAFIKVASHEFRTPVTILGGLCKLALLNQSEHGEVLGHLAQIDG
ncbi:MAG TPA: response regulator, partial [Tepidisphaeraceae bacterium]|nr:response regulator [Tepidisphaeraceae bacterium]